MQKRTAILALTDEFSTLLTDADADRKVVLSGKDGAELRMSVGWVVNRETKRREGPVVWLFLDADGLDADCRARAYAYFDGIGRRPRRLSASSKHPLLTWFLNLGEDAGIAAEAAVLIFNEVFDPLDGDYRVAVAKLAPTAPALLPDDGRRERRGRTEPT